MKATSYYFRGKHKVNLICQFDKEVIIHVNKKKKRKRKQ